MGLRRPARRRLERPDHRLHAARGITPFAAKERPVNDRTPNSAPAAKPASRTDAPLHVGVLVLLVIAAVVIIVSFQRSFPTPQADKQRSYDPQPAVGYSGSDEATVVVPVDVAREVPQVVHPRTAPHADFLTTRVLQLHRVSSTS